MALVSARPDRDMLIASVALQGLWSSENGTTTWTALGSGAGSAKVTNRGSSIVYDPDRLNTFWESGTYNAGAVYRTDDNGASFRQLGFISHADAVSVDLTDPARRTLLTNRHETSNLYRSTDGGTMWSDISASLPSNVGFTTGPYVINAQTHLLGTNNGARSGVYRTTDGGSTWTNVYDHAVVGTPLLAHSGGALYWVLGAGGIIQSTDGGATWKQVARDGTLSNSASNLVELPNGNLAAVGNQVVIVSADHGATWRSVGPGMPYAPSGLTYSPFRNAFYIWHFDCDFSTNNPIPANAILSLSYDYKTQ
jgi:hypothetical protein